MTGELDGEMEMWVVVGDLPPVTMDTSETPTPALALKLYFAICQDWAETVLSDGDLLECHPIRAAPTKEHAEMLLGRLEFIREELIPAAAG